MRTLLPVLLLTLLLAGCGKAPPAAQPPKVGDLAPNAEFVSIDGQQHQRLESLRGKLVVLHFWATWCAPCRKEIPSMERLAQKLDPQRFALLGVSVDEDRNMVDEFKRKYGIKFANLIDSEMRVAKQSFGVTAFPETFIIGRDGTVLRHMMGEHEWDTPAMLQVLNDAYNGVTTKSGAYW